MPEDGRAEVVHHALADLVREQGLDHAEHAGGDRDGDHPARVERQRPRVVHGDRLEHALEQEGGDDAERGRDDDQQQDSAQPQLVRGEEWADAAQVGAAHRRIGSALGSPVGRVEEHTHGRSGYAARSARPPHS
jgi:hypothetical protein